MKTKRFLYLLLILLAVVFAASCEKNGETERENDEQNEHEFSTEEMSPEFSVIGGKELFLDPEADVEDRVESFIGTVFRDPKIVFFDNYDNMTEELGNFIFHVGVYRFDLYSDNEYIYDENDKTIYGLTKEMIEENIKTVFGEEVINKLNYDHLPADYLEEQGIYRPWIYGAASNAIAYMFYGVENIEGNIYRALVSYIDTNGAILSIDEDGMYMFPPEYIMEMEEGLKYLIGSDYTKKRLEVIEELKKYMMSHPERYERAEIYLEVGDDYINLLSAKKYMDPDAEYEEDEEYIETEEVDVDVDVEEADVEEEAE